MTKPRGGGGRTNRRPGFIVEFVGPAGCGKTRVADEVQSKLAGEGLTPPRTYVFKRREPWLQRWAATARGVVRVAAKPRVVVSGLRLALIVRPREPADLRWLLHTFFRQAAWLAHLRTRPGVHVLGHGMAQTLRKARGLGPGGKRLGRYRRLVEGVLFGDIVVQLEVDPLIANQRRVLRNKPILSTKVAYGPEREKKLRALARRFVDAGWPEDDILPLAERFNARSCSPPFEAAVVQSLVETVVDERGELPSLSADARRKAAARSRKDIIPSLLAQRGDLRFLRLPNNTLEELETTASTVVTEVKRSLRQQPRLPR